jgi:hypothetical protein
MEQRGVRRITVEAHAASNEKWDAGWVPPLARRVREWAFAEAPRLAYWGGWAGIVGAVLWGVVFFYLQFLQYAFWFDWPILYTSTIPYIRTQVLVVPILMFMVCLFWLFVQEEKDRHPRPRLRRLGFVLANLGLVFTALTTVDSYWLWRLLGIASPGYIHHLYAGPIADWDKATFTGFVLAGAGMVLCGIAGIRARSSLTLWAVSFIAAPLIYFVVRLGLVFLLGPYERYTVLQDGGVFVHLMLLFGVAWAVAGYHLLRSEGRVRATQAGA